MINGNPSSKDDVTSIEDVNPSNMEPNTLVKSITSSVKQLIDMFCKSDPRLRGFLNAIAYGGQDETNFVNRLWRICLVKNDAEKAIEEKSTSNGNIWINGWYYDVDQGENWLWKFWGYGFPRGLNYVDFPDRLQYIQSIELLCQSVNIYNRLMKIDSDSLKEWLRMKRTEIFTDRIKRIARGEVLDPL